MMICPNENHFSYVALCRNGKNIKLENYCVRRFGADEIDKTNSVTKANIVGSGACIKLCDIGGCVVHISLVSNKENSNEICMRTNEYLKNGSNV